MATAIESYNGSDQENFFRLCILIVDYALTVLQDVLQEELTKKYPNNIFDPNTGLLCGVLGYGNIKEKLYKLLVFNKQQKDQLYPSGNPSTSVTVGDLDITLTVFLLRNITTLRKKSKAWNNPVDSNTSKEAEIVRVKNYRNHNFAHIKGTAISLVEFRKKFSGLKSSLLALSGRYSSEEYDAILREPLGAKHEGAVIKEVTEWMMKHGGMIEGIYETVQEMRHSIRALARRISPGLRSRSSSQSDSDDSPAPSTSRSGQKSGRPHKKRAKTRSRSRYSTLSDKDSPEPSTSASGQKSGNSDRRTRRGKRRIGDPDPQFTKRPAKRSKRHAATTTGTRCQAPETKPKESMNKQIASFYIRHMSQIQRLPWDPNDTMHIDDVYVNLEWVQEKNNPTGPSFDQSQGYTSIFKDTKQGKAPKRILVRGKAGIGKTTFTQKMATDWANAILGSTTCEGILSNYKYLLILNLRSILPHQTLKKAIEMQIPCSAEKEVIEDIMCALNEDRNKVLLVFDGYDEYDPNTSKEITDIILGRQYPEVCTVITSRPWKAEELMNRRITDGVYEITGLTEDNIAEYVAKFFDDGQEEPKFNEHCLPLKEESLQAIGKGLVGYLQRRELMSLAKIPIVLLFICLMWQGNQTSDTTAVSLPASYTLLYEKILRLIIRRKNNIKKESEVDKYLEELNDTFLHLGERALHGLLKPGGGLIFDEEDLLSIPHISELYSLGLLSRSKVHSNLDIKQEVTFLHKTIQELFAAKYLARTTDESDSDLEWFLGGLDGYARLRDMDYVLLFLCGLSKTATIKVLRRAYALHGENDEKEFKHEHFPWLQEIDSSFCHEGWWQKWIYNLLLEHWYAHCPNGTVLPPELIPLAIPWQPVLHIPQSFHHSDTRFQQALWDSVDSALSNPRTCAVILTNVSIVTVGLRLTLNTQVNIEEDHEKWHKLLSILNTCYTSERLIGVSWSTESLTCNVCKCALNNVLSKAPNLQKLEITTKCSGVLSSLPNPGKLVNLVIRNINGEDCQVIQQMVSLKYIYVKDDEMSRVPAPLQGTLPNISHDLVKIMFENTRLGAKGVKSLGKNLRHVPGLEYLGLGRVFMQRTEWGPDCGPSRCTCPRGKDNTDYDRCQDVCEAVRELSQGVIHTTKLTHFLFWANGLGLYHGITSPLIALIQSLSKVSEQTGMEIDMDDNILGRVDRLSELIEAIVRSYQHVSSWGVFGNGLEEVLPKPDYSLRLHSHIFRSIQRF